MRRERPHPGAQPSFTDSGGHRFQAILTDRAGGAAELEREHRARARCEDRIRCAKQMGLELLPFADFAMNAVWMELVLIAGAMVAWTDTLLLRGELSGLEPKRLRYRALHTAGRLTFHARHATLRLERRWPWTRELAAAFARLHELPAPAGSPGGGSAEPRLLSSERSSVQRGLGLPEEPHMRAAHGLRRPPSGNNRPHTGTHTSFLRAGVTRGRLVNDSG